MPKGKITMTVELEYEIVPSYYSSKEDTDEKRVSFDARAYRDLPDMLLWHEDAVVTVTSDLVKE